MNTVTYSSLLLAYTKLRTLSLKLSDHGNSGYVLVIVELHSKFSLVLVAEICALRFQQGGGEAVICISWMAFSYRVS